MGRKLLCSALALVSAVLTLALTLGQDRRLMTIDDIYRLKTVDDPQVSPEGEWVAFTVSWMDEKSDRNDSDIYMVRWAGGEAVRLTTSEKPDTTPRWSPDGRYLAFLSERDGKKDQVWLLDRRGGEAVRLTHFQSGVKDLVWSPDGSRLALVVQDPDPEDAVEDTAPNQEKERRPRPIVIDRLQFKRDEEGYLRDFRDHLHLFDLEHRTSFQLTHGPYDDSSPNWSPDGRFVAFVSNRTEEPDSNENTDIFLVEAREGAEPEALTSWRGADSSPSFSPDGNWIAYVEGGPAEDIWYATNNIAALRVEGGKPASTPRVLTGGLDRNVSHPAVLEDNSGVVFVLEDRCRQVLAKVSWEGNGIDRLVETEGTLSRFHRNPGGNMVALESRTDRPAEVLIVEGAEVRRLTHVNDRFLEEVRLASVERFEAVSRDGTVVDAFLTRPPDSVAGHRYPTLLRIHGGPVSQYETEFSLEWQILAARGYAIVAANPRGSSGRGRDFSRAIWADWGNKDFEDVMASIDKAIEMGIANPERLGVGGWSYGGILTNYVITQTDRFQAAVSGASEVNYTANYGHDHYQYIWEAELGLPWENLDLWVRLSPFFKVDQIKTPTLILCGQIDWNVPLLNSEQLYQALRRLGVETQLVIYPGESHGIDRPSFKKDRLERYIAWYDRFLKPNSGKTTQETASPN